MTSAPDPDPRVANPLEARAQAAPTPDEPAIPPIYDSIRTREERRAHLRDAALQAKRRTGDRERTAEQARRGVIARVAIIAFGSFVTLLGIALMPLPGPGIVVVLAGLGILATEVSWAERALTYAKRRSKVDALTAQAPWLKPASIAVTVIGTAASLLYTFRWR